MDGPWTSVDSEDEYEVAVGTPPPVQTTHNSPPTPPRGPAFPGLRREMNGPPQSTHERASMTSYDAATKVLPSPTAGLPKIRNVELQELIGRGQTADVYLGIHERLRRAVAVKILHDHLSDSPEVVNRFRQEASVIADLHHPGIMQIHDLDEVDGRSYIVMEHLSGPTLAQHISETVRKRGRIPVRDVIRIVTQVADALGFAHRLGILHRDVKPANIVLRSPTKEVSPGGALPADAMPVLTDFGLARLNNRPRMTRDGITVGTPAYMSPEQVMGDPLDERSDVYSLGVIMYEMLTGDLPPVKNTESLTGVMYKQVHEEFPRLPPHLRRLQPIVDRCLAKDRQMRFPSTAELIDALREYQEAYLGAEGVRASLQRSRLNLEALRAKLIGLASPVRPEPSGPDGKPRSTLLNVRGLRDVLLGSAAPAPRPAYVHRAWATNLNLNYLRERLIRPSAESMPVPARARPRKNRRAPLAILLGALGLGTMALAAGIVPGGWLDRVLSGGVGDQDAARGGGSADASPTLHPLTVDASPTTEWLLGAPSPTSTAASGSSTPSVIPPTSTPPPPTATSAPTDSPPDLPLPTLPPILPTLPF